MKRTFGIISGAGPMAGISLLKQVINLCQKNGAWEDADFPEIRLINFPFSDMLKPGFDEAKIRFELNRCLKELQLTCDHIVIACQTLHLFLPHEDFPQLVNLIDLIKEALQHDRGRPLIVASRTSAHYNLHGRLLGVDCEYWDVERSQGIIDAILRGEKIDLDWLLELSRTRPVILGCTEYSVALEGVPSSLGIIDPIKLVAHRVFELSKIEKNEDVYSDAVVLK